MRLLPLLLLLAACGQGGAPSNAGDPPMPTPRPSPAGGQDAVGNVMTNEAAAP